MKPYFLLIAVFSVAANAQVATSPTFTLDQSVVANGGGKSTSPTFDLSGTTGQAAAGVSAVGPTFAHASGFWLPASVPTAASVSIRGRVVLAGGQGIRNVVVTLTDSFGIVRSTRSGSFGGYEFTGVTAGETYVVGVTSRRYSFSDPQRVIAVGDSAVDIDFTGLGN